MANKYNDILTITANDKNQMGLSNTIKRDYGIPLDFTSVQADFAAAVEYAATSTLAYVGQPISVGDKLYIITAESQGKYPAEVEEGGSQQDVFLAEVGSATEGDGNTIDLKDGVLSLHGIDGKTTGTYVPTLVNGVLTWNAPDNTTVDGLTASVDALNLKVFGKAANEDEGTEAVEGLVTIVAENTEAIADNAEAISENATAIENITKAETGAIATAIAAEAEARDTAIETAFTNIVGDVAEDTTIVGMIGEVEAKIPTNNNQLTNGAGYQTASDVATAINNANKADKATTLAGYGITDAYTKEEVNNAIAGITHFTTKVVTSVDEVTATGVLYLIKDTEATGADKYNEYLFIENVGATLIGDTTTDLADYVTNNALTTALAPYAKTNDVVTKDEFTKFEQTNSQAIADARTNAVSDVEAKGYAIEESVKARLNNKVDSSTLNNYYTSKQIDDKGYAIAGTVNAELDKKVETATITHTSEGVSEGVTKEDNNLKIVVDAYTKEQVYTKSETDAAITAKINSVTGGESAADVKLALEDYRDALNSEIWGADAAKWTTKVTGDDGKVTVTYTPQYGTTSRVDTLESEVATLKTNVQKAQADATAAGTAVSTLESGKVDTNAANIATIQGQITGEGGLSARIGALEATNTTHATEYTTLKTKVDTAVDTTIPALTNRVANNEAALVTINNTLNGVEDTEGLIATVGKKANAADVYTKNEVDAKVITSGEVIHGTTDSVSIADNKITVTVNSYTKSEVDTAISTAIGNIDNTAITNNSADIAVLVGNDKGEDGRANKSIRAIAAAEIERLIQVADEGDDGHTIQSIQNLVDYVEANAGEIAALVTATGANTAKLAGIETTVSAAIQAAKKEAIDAIPALEVATAEKLGGVKSSAAENKVAVAEDGTMEVNSINVNKLVQTDGDILILNGGTAGTTANN